MIKEKQIYRCNICGNIVEVLEVGGGELFCCGEPMEVLEEKTKEEGQEKHLPLIQKTEKGILVKVGEITHPMEENHYIKWIEVEADGKIYIKFLTPKDKPEEEFCLEEGKKIQVRVYCNLHGLWRNLE